MPSLATSLQSSANRLKKTLPFTLYPLPFQRGFTLIEILITIAIISLGAAVAIPNLNNFNQNQGLTNAAADIKNLIKKAQSNAQAGITCSDASQSKSVSWNIEPSGVSMMKLTCTYYINNDPNLGTLNSNETTYNASPVNITYSCDGNPTTVTFKSNTFNLNTILLGECSSYFKVILSKNGQLENVYVTSGGNIYESTN